jgi:hypothetical protein
VQCFNEHVVIATREFFYSGNLHHHPLCR